MKKGCLIFAHDGDIDYGSQAVLAASLVNKNLEVPVSLAADKLTIGNIKSKFSTLPFDQIIEVENSSTNFRNLSNERVEFKNNSRSRAFDITPYDRTLLIDSDFLVLSNHLNKYWDNKYDFLITPGMLELQQDKVKPKEYRLSQNSIKMVWATNIMFSKTPEVKMLFDLVDFVKQEYSYFSQLYEFDPYPYRNDFAFSIACFIMAGFPNTPWHGELPVPLFYRDTDEILTVENNEINFLLKNINGNDYILSKCRDQDVHIMNKRTILENLDKLLELAQ